MTLEQKIDTHLNQLEFGKWIKGIVVFDNLDGNLYLDLQYFISYTDSEKTEQCLDIISAEVQIKNKLYYLGFKMLEWGSNQDREDYHIKCFKINKDIDIFR